MKGCMNNKLIIAFSLFVLIAFTSCRYRHNTNISIHEQRDSYEFYASYSKNKAAKVQRYLDERLGSSEFYRSELENYDRTEVMNDDTKFYIQSEPGRLKIKLDKRENTEASYKRVKHICDGLKDVLK